jgi:hypothetical protein
MFIKNNQIKVIGMFKKSFDFYYVINRLKPEQFQFLKKHTSKIIAVES